MNILVAYRGASRIRGWETGALISQAFRELGHTVHEYGHVFETQETITSPDFSFSNFYDLVLIMEMNDPHPQPFTLLNIACDQRVFWSFDCSYYFSYALQIMRAFRPHKVFCANYYLINPLQDLLGVKTFFLPYAAAPQHFRSYEPKNKEIDVALVGTARPDRIELIEKLKDFGLDARLISNVYKEQYIDVLAKTWIVINQNPKEGAGLINMRGLESPAAGTFIFNQHGDGIEQVFRKGKEDHFHFPIYDPDDIDDLADQCYSILEFGAISEDGERWIPSNQEYIKKNHTYVNRAQTILDTLNF